MMIKLKLLLLLLFVFSTVKAQNDTIALPFGVYGKGKVKNNKILLKWAVNDPVLWRKSLTTGYRVLRTTVTKDGVPIMKDETIVLYEKLVPLPLKDWEPFAKNDTIALVVAQAIYGEDFEVTQPKKGVAAMMMVTEKNQQRYAFAMMAAEQSFTATKAAGW